MLKAFTTARKATAGLVGVIAAVSAMNLLPSPWQEVTVALVALGTYVGVYQTENKKTQTPEE
jgi:uncharacterized membrane protein